MLINDLAMTIDETEGTANATTDLAKNEKAIAPTPPPSPLSDDVGKEIPENEMCTLRMLSCFYCFPVFVS